MELTETQKRATELVSAYQAQHGEALAERTAGIVSIQADFSARWTELQGEINAARLKGSPRNDLGAQENDARAIAAALEVAQIVERHAAAKQRAFEELERVLPSVPSFGDWLEAQSLERPEDGVVKELLAKEREEVCGITGKLVAPGGEHVVLADLSPSVGGDGLTRFSRGGAVVIVDRAERLDVMKMDRADIEAAVKLAAQRFDLDQGLVLTGDRAFKLQAAEICGRMGLRIANNDPELIAAFERGEKVFKSMQQGNRRDLQVEANAITGKRAGPEKSADPSISTISTRDPSRKAMLESVGIAYREVDGAILVDEPAATLGKLVLAEDRLGKSTVAAIAMPGVRADGGLPDDAQEQLVNEGLVDPHTGKLTRNGVLMVVARDHRIALDVERAMGRHGPGPGLGTEQTVPGKAMSAVESAVAKGVQPFEERQAEVVEDRQARDLLNPVKPEPEAGRGADKDEVWIPTALEEAREKLEKSPEPAKDRGEDPMGLLPASKPTPARRKVDLGLER